MTEQTVMSEDQIKSIYATDFLPNVALQGEWSKWLSDYADTIERIQGARDDGSLASADVQRVLWEENGVSGAGMCSIKLDPAIENESFRLAIAEAISTKLPDDHDLMAKKLQEVHGKLHEECGKRLKRMPWVKIMRALAAVYPENVTCVIDHSRLRILAKGLLTDLKHGDLNAGALIALNVRILERIDSVLDSPFGSDYRGLAKRSMFTWQLFSKIVHQQADKDGVDQEEKLPGEETPTIKFLPQERRRSGLTAINGYLNTALKLLDNAESGITLDEAASFIQSEFPNLQLSSAKHYVSVIRHQLGLLALNENVLKPSALGQQCLDSGETEDIQNLIIPRILRTVNSYDCILHVLRETSGISRTQMIAALRRHYTPWTTDFSPSSQLKWAEALGLIEVAPDGKLRLTDCGTFWAAAVPEDLAPVVISSASADQVTDLTTGKEFNIPALDDLLERINASPLVFPKDLIIRLHVALHAHPHKHFALLSGLSGTGKTQLAKVYANAYHNISPNTENEYFRLIAVQPDWTDPTGLLGYINPLHEATTYEVTACLRFLQHCLEYPLHPHFLCLDEMNLARVEYYLAPFLSAMESGEPIQIHQQPESVDGVEPKIPWPENLYILGTVNMDETTYAFSDKVLDRAFTIEFWDVDLDAFAAKFAPSLPDFDNQTFTLTIDMLKALSAILLPVHLHFGYRTAEEVLRFIAVNASTGKQGLKYSDALDHATFMKILPKVRGQDSPRLRNCLSQLKDFASQHGLHQTERKVLMMTEDLVSTGTARFWR